MSCWRNWNAPLSPRPTPCQVVLVVVVAVADAMVLVVAAAAVHRNTDWNPVVHRVARRRVELHDVGVVLDRHDEEHDAETEGAEDVSLLPRRTLGAAVVDTN